MKVQRCVIFNPTARGDKARRFREYLAQLDNCRFQPTTGTGSARILAAEAVRDGFEIIIAAGGDGTLNEVLNGIGDVPGGFDKCRLAVIPLGTINVFALETGIPAAPEAAWQIIVQDDEMRIDIAEGTFQTRDGIKSRYFLQMAGAGFDARAVELVDWNLKKMIGPLAYVWAGLNALRRPQGIIRISSDTKSVSGEMAVVGNGRFYAGKFTFCPEAKYTDGLLDVCVFPKVTLARLPGYSLAALTDRLAKHNLTANFSAKEIHLSSDVRVPIHLDGEPVGELPATIRVQPRKLRMIVP
ncbi:MAG: diacylglycerol kinase family lipid kinase [Verrucomicrobiales bacterium]|nr:diacylglycerol kinase family lipid kinase [Verrucomicrobiales bacterium]